ncbi:Btc protein-like [Scleropages formosus]|uniref:Btc protein-like n=1 Tax=Scleropages formosus TaxID=113540 RepID=A0A0P7TJP0_SCLFO|nr:Btc protein-like [Scleropages formosus]
MAPGALCKHSRAEWNATREPASGSVSCNPHGNSSQCAAATEEYNWSGHFSECPEEFLQFCVHGRCRFLTEQNMPSCVCLNGYIGSRCEYVDLDLHTGDQKHVVIACVIATLVFLILLVVFICIYAHRHKLCYKKNQKKEEKAEEAEKLNMAASTSEGRECRSSVHAETETNTEIYGTPN